MSGRIGLISFPVRMISLLGFSATRLQITDVFDDLVDLRIVKGRAESWHGAWLAVLDAVANKIVVSFCVHELRPLAGGAATVGMTPSAGRCEQPLDVQQLIARRGSGRLRSNRPGASQ